MIHNFSLLQGDFDLSIISLSNNNRAKTEFLKEVEGLSNRKYIFVQANNLDGYQILFSGCLVICKASYTIPVRAIRPANHIRHQ
jgi:hypothetical protein